MRGVEMAGWVFGFLWKVSGLYLAMASESKSRGHNE